MPKRSGAEGLPRSLTRKRVRKMRKINEFKGYRSTVEYDAATGQFVVTPSDEYFPQEPADETPAADIVPFPAQTPAAPKQQRRAG